MMAPTLLAIIPISTHTLLANNESAGRFGTALTASMLMQGLRWPSLSGSSAKHARMLEPSQCSVSCRSDFFSLQFPRSDIA